MCVIACVCECIGLKHLVVRNRVKIIWKTFTCIKLKFGVVVIHACRRIRLHLPLAWRYSEVLAVVASTNVASCKRNQIQVVISWNLILLLLWHSGREITVDMDFVYYRNSQMVDWRRSMLVSAICEVDDAVVIYHSWSSCCCCWCQGFHLLVSVLKFSVTAADVALPVSDVWHCRQNLYRPDKDAKEKESEFWFVQLLVAQKRLRSLSSCWGLLIGRDRHWPSNPIAMVDFYRTRFVLLPAPSCLQCVFKILCECAREKC